MSAQSVWALISHKDTLLFVQRSLTTSRPGQWCLPGGGIHAGETPEEACVREVREEVGLAVVVEGLLCEVEGFLFFRCALARPVLGQASGQLERAEEEPEEEPAKEEEPAIVLSERECADFRWVRASELLGLGPIMEFHRMQTVLAQLERED